MNIFSTENAVKTSKTVRSMAPAKKISLPSTISIVNNNETIIADIVITSSVFLGIIDWYNNGVVLVILIFASSEKFLNSEF